MSRMIGAALAALWLLPACASTASSGREYDDVERQIAHDLAGGELSSSASPASSRARGDGPRVELGLTLALDRLLELARSRSPGVRQALHGWQAAAARVPQATALDDPMLTVGDCWPCLHTRAGDMGVQVSLSQTFPWPGKRGHAGEAALGETAGAASDYRGLRLAVDRDVRHGFYQLYRLARDEALVRSDEDLFRTVVASATARFEAGSAAEADVLDARMRLADLDRVLLDLESERATAVASLDALLDRAPDAPLPPPPASLPVEAVAPPSADYRSLALAHRPEIAHALAEARASRAHEAVAELDRYPDIGVMLQYTQIMNNGVPGYSYDGQDTLMAALSITLPWFQLGKRRAAAQEAEAEEAAATDAARVAGESALADVVSAEARAEHAQHELALYEGTLLPLARETLAAARAAYETGRADLEELLDAESQLLDDERTLADTTADLGTATADLLYAAGLDAAPEGSPSPRSQP